MYHEDVLGMKGASGVVSTRPLALRRTPQKPTTDPAPLDPAPVDPAPAVGGLHAGGPPAGGPHARWRQPGADSAVATPPKAGKGGRKGARTK